MFLLSQFVYLGLATSFATLASASSSHHNVLHREATKEFAKWEREHEGRNEPGLHKIRSTLSLARGLIQERGTIGVPEEELRSILDRIKSLEAEVSSLLGAPQDESTAVPPPANTGNVGSAGTPVSDPPGASANGIQDSVISAPIVSIHPTAKPIQPVNGQMEPKVDSGGDDGNGVAIPVAGSGPVRPVDSNEAHTSPQSLNLVSEVPESLVTPTIIAAAGSLEGLDSADEPMAVFKEKVYVTTEDLKTTTVIKTRTSIETITLHRATAHGSQHKPTDTPGEKFAEPSPEASSLTAASYTQPSLSSDEKFFKNSTVDFMKQVHFPPKPTLTRNTTTKAATQSHPVQEVKVPANDKMKSVHPPAASEMKIPVTSEATASRANSITKVAFIDDKAQAKFTPQKNSTDSSAEIDKEKVQVDSQAHKNATKTAAKIATLGNATAHLAAERQKIVPDTFPDISPINRVAHHNATSAPKSETDAPATPTAAVDKMKGHVKAVDFNSTMVTSTRSKI